MGISIPCSPGFSCSGSSELESWAWSPVVALPKLHVPQEQDWLGVGDKDLLSCPLHLFPPPYFALAVDSQGFWAWGVG